MKTGISALKVETTLKPKLHLSQTYHLILKKNVIYMKVQNFKEFNCPIKKNLEFKP